MNLMMLLMLLKLGTELGKVVDGADRLSIPILWLRPPLGWLLLYEGMGFPDGAAGLATEPELPEEGEARTAEPLSSGGPLAGGTPAGSSISAWEHHLL